VKYLDSSTAVVVIVVVGDEKEEVSLFSALDVFIIDESLEL
jgi:hypothetical protein